MKKIPIRHITTSQKELLTSERFKIRKVEELLDKEDLFHELHRHDFFFIIAFYDSYKNNPLQSCLGWQIKVI